MLAPTVVALRHDLRGAKAGSPLNEVGTDLKQKRS